MGTVATNRAAAVDAYIGKAKPFAQPILEYLRELVHEGVPEVEEAIKWSHPFFVHRGIILANLGAFKEHCSLGFWGAETTAEMRKDGVATGGSMGSFGRITSLDDLPSRAQMLRYIRDAAKRIDDGTRTTSIARKPRVAKPAIDIPEALAAALAKHKGAAGKFDAMSPSCRREYCDWIASAKREETRVRRVAEALSMIAEGKSRNWKYEAR